MATTGLFTSLRSFVNQSFQLHPQLANGLTGFGVFAGGDVLSQSLEAVAEGDNIDTARSVRTGTLGAVMNGGVSTNSCSACALPVMHHFHPSFRILTIPSVFFLTIS
jgi:hypothetical protein